MFFVAERAADIAQVRVMRIDLDDRTAGVAVRVVVSIGYCLAFVLTVAADTGVLSGRLCGALRFVAGRAVNPLVFE